MAADFSKKMCQQLLLYEDMIFSCSSVPFQKDKIIVERNKLLDLIYELRLHHCAERNLKLSSSDLQEVPEMQMADSQGEQRVVEKQNNEEISDIYLTRARAEAERIIQQAHQDADEIIKDAQHERLLILDKAKQEEDEIIKEAQYESTLILNKVQQEAEKYESVIRQAQDEAAQIIAKAEELCVVEMEKMKQDMRNEAAEVMDKAKIDSEEILTTARVQADLFRSRAEAEIQQKEAEQEERVNAVLKDAEAEAAKQVQEKLQASNEVLENTVELTKTMLDQLSEAYDKQIAVVHEDRREILAIIETLERKMEK